MPVTGMSEMIVYRTSSQGTSPGAVEEARKRWAKNRRDAELREMSLLPRREMVPCCMGWGGMG